MVCGVLTCYTGYAEDRGGGNLEGLQYIPWTVGINDRHLGVGAWTVRNPHQGRHLFLLCILQAFLVVLPNKTKNFQLPYVMILLLSIFYLKLVSFKTTNDNFLSLFQFLVKQNKKNSSKSLISFNCHLLCQKISFCSKLIKLPFLSISGWSRVIPWVPGWGGRPRPWPLSCRSLTRGDWSRTHWHPPLSPHLGSSLRSDLHLQHTRSVDKIYQ